MKRLHLLIAASSLALMLPVQSSAMELDALLGEINVSAHADLGKFRVDLSATFGISPGEVDGLLEICDSPADVYVTLRLGKIARVPTEQVIIEYRANKAKGWGAIAKNLGIKPGSPEFHALKQGRLTAHARDGSSVKQGKSKGSK